MRSLTVLPAPGPVTPRRILPCILVLGALALPPASAVADLPLPDPDLSFYVPQVGTTTTPLEGAGAARLFRACPNNDGGISLPNNARIKVVVKDGMGNPVPGIAAVDIAVLLNGGTLEQGFSGIGADSIVSNSTWNTDPLCPDLRAIQADAPTDINGATFITFAGATPGSPGVATRDPNRKWGHYDSELPVYALTVKLSGRLTSASSNGTYALQIRNFDCQEGLGAELNEGEAVTMADFTCVMRHINVSGPISYWLDFDGSGAVGSIDFNMLVTHLNHDCDTPDNP